MPRHDILNTTLRKVNFHFVIGFVPFPHPFDQPLF